MKQVSNGQIMNSDKQTNKKAALKSHIEKKSLDSIIQKLKVKHWFVIIFESKFAMLIT